MSCYFQNNVILEHSLVYFAVSVFSIDALLHSALSLSIKFFLQIVFALPYFQKNKILVLNLLVTHIYLFQL